MLLPRRWHFMLMFLRWKGEIVVWSLLHGNIPRLIFDQTPLHVPINAKIEALQRGIIRGRFEVKKELHVVASKPGGHEIEFHLHITSIQK